MSSARSAPPPARPAWPACAPAPKPQPPPTAATTTPPSASRSSPGSYHALHEAYRQRETVFATIMADRADWDAATRAQRHLAVAADAELRRRHPDQHFSPLRSAEPEPATDSQRAELTLTPEPAAGRDGPVDHGPGRRAPHLRRAARRPAEPEGPLRGSPLR